jgi:arginine deiminase
MKVTTVLGVHSEVGRLRQAILHRPGLELSRLTPNNIKELLFDDIMWAKRAREEHDAFADALRDKGVQVHYFAELLAQTLDQPDGRSYVLDRVCTPEIVGPALVGPIRALFDDADSQTLVEYLIGGVLKADLHPAHVHSLTWSMLTADDFVLPPLPNHLFQRDNSCWVYGGVSINPMAKPARRRETLHSRAIYQHHPLFREAGFEIWYGGDDRSHLPATIEGGDVHVLGHRTVLIGMGERTTPMAVEILARQLFAGDAADRIIAIELPRSHAFMHLDTIMSMIDRDTFVVYPYLDHHLRSWTVTAGDVADELRVAQNPDLWPAIAEALEVDKVTVLKADEDVRAAAREQWDDGTNFLAVAPGVVFGYERNVTTNTMLRRHGIEVVSVRGSELGRGRGGPRCMTCPISREAVQ